MLEIRELHSLLNKSECGNLEFKREWYWKKGESKSIIEGGWGEFLKDFASLTNANSRYYNEKRFLIFGFSEEKIFYNIELPENNIEKFKVKVYEKINSFFNFTPKYEILNFKIKDSNIIVFCIQQPNDILKIKKEFFDKKGNISRINSTYVRGIMGKEDQIDLCDNDELLRLIKVLDLNIEPKDIDNKIEYRNIDKAMECFQQINQLYSLTKGYPKNISNQTPKYKSKIYEFDDGFDNTVTFLYVNSSTNIKQLIIRLKKDSLIKNKFTLITDEPINIDPEARLKNIQNSFTESGFSILKIFYLHEFGINYLYKNTFKNIEFKKFKENQSYVESNALVQNSSTPRNAHKVLNLWYKEVYKPIVVIQGEGGIGKTTLIKQHVNNISDIQDDTKIIYMSSSDILKKIDIEQYESNIVLYDFYNIESNHNKLNNDLLKFSLDDGKIVLVLDGIDEVISSLGAKFDFEFFINDIIKEYCFNNGNCKVLLTCRNQFWEQLNYGYNDSITLVNLIPFDDNQVKEYFEKTFDDTISIKACIQYTKKFSKGLSEYSPFMLDTIKYLVERNNDENSRLGSNRADNVFENSSDESDESEILYNDGILSNNNSNDLLISSICRREKIKLDLYDFKDQLDIFIKLAVFFNGEIELTMLSKIYPDIDNYRSIALMSHPLLIKDDNYAGSKIIFKYDFLKSYFEEIFIALNISKLDDENKDLSFLNSLKNIGYANQLSNNILKRVEFKIRDSESEFIDYCILMLINIKNIDDSLDSKITYSNFIVLSIYLYVNIFSKNCDDFIYEVLEKSNVIEDLYLINISQSYSSSKKLSFNFTNKTIKNSYFHNYDFFWDCKFNQSTKIIYSHLKGIKSKPPKSIDINKKTFSNCQTDLAFNGYLSDLFDTKENILSKSRKHITKILRIFVSNGNFLPQKIVRVNSDVSKFSGNHSLEKLLKHDVIIKHADSYMLESEYIISEDYEDLLDVVTQGNNSIKMDKLVKLVASN